MEKRNIKSEYFIGILILLLVFVPLTVIQNNNMTGKAIGSPGGPPEGANSGGMMIGPTAEQQACMSSCMGCSSPGGGCVKNQEQCMAQCGLEPEPEAANEGESCMQECVIKGCSEFDFSCQEINKAKCEKECDMKGDAPDESEISAEQICITECVAKVDSMTRCGNSKEGETGGALCQKCAADCVHLYAGPCLDDKKLKAKQKECETCEHCYGEPVMGDSGEGWECITDIECKDASSEFGDEPGTGPGIGQEGFVANVGEAIGNVFEGIGNFFKGLFSRGESSE